jgi:ribosomal protein S18 acetylase RimI-like enzyme
MAGDRPLLTRPETAQDLDRVRRLIRQYADSLDFNLEFQDFDGELRRLPGDYAPPEGCLIVAISDEEPVGCVALRRFEDGICEMKRLYILPSQRRTGIGRILVEAIINAARQIGYRKMRLDTVPSMKAARRLYKSVGFVEIGPYRYNPIDGATFMEIALSPISNQG